MKVTILGNYGPYPKADGACSGYLIENDNTKILIDCGNGTLSRLLKICDVADIDMIILSHLHSDHMSDILVYKYAIGLRKIKEKLDISIPLYTPMDDKDMVEKLNYNDAFKISAITEELELNINGMKIEFKRMKHPVETYAVKITVKEKVFVYSGDTSYNEDLIDFAKLSDFFLCEAGVLELDRNEETPHLSARQAGEIGERARVKRLVLTHFFPEYRKERIMEEASQTYNSILELSEEMRTYYL